MQDLDHRLSQFFRWVLKRSTVTHREPLFLGRGHCASLVALLVRIDDGDPVPGGEELPDAIFIICTVHQRIQTGGPLSNHPFQRNGSLAVMEVRSGNKCRHRNIAVGDIQMKLAALPIPAVPLTVALAS